MEIKIDRCIWPSEPLISALIPARNMYVSGVVGRRVSFFSNISKLREIVKCVFYRKLFINSSFSFPDIYSVLRSGMIAVIVALDIPIESTTSITALKNRQCVHNLIFNCIKLLRDNFCIGA